MAEYAVEKKCINCGEYLQYSHAKSIWYCPNCNWGFNRLIHKNGRFAGYMEHRGNIFYPAAPSKSDAVLKWARLVYHNFVGYAAFEGKRRESFAAKVCELMNTAPEEVKNDRPE